ncbi:MAG: hypothetical protein K0U66_07410 [Gammaproteobacteria bacterium]|nr:hypothetical protein [Gammaproteobacteria bacterium]
MKIEIHPHKELAHVTISESAGEYLGLAELIQALEELFASPQYHYAPPSGAWRLKFRICTLLRTSVNATEFRQNLIEAFGSFYQFASANHLQTTETKEADGLRVCVDLVCIQPRRGGDGKHDGQPFDPVAAMEAALGGTA